MQDVYDRAIEIGEDVIYCGRDDPQNGLSAGSIHRIEKEIRGRSAPFLKFEGYTREIPQSYVLKLVGSLPLQQNNFSAQADAIIKLINSKPWSPRKEEIVAILRGEKP